MSDPLRRKQTFTDPTNAKHKIEVSAGGSGGSKGVFGKLRARLPGKAKKSKLSADQKKALLKGSVEAQTGNPNLANADPGIVSNIYARAISQLSQGG